MKYTSDYKKAALDALRDHWPSALIVSVIMSIIAGGGNNSSTVNIRVTREVDLEYYLNTFKGSGIWPVISIVLAIAAAASFIIAIVYFALGGVIKMGHCTFNLNLIDRKNPQIADVFSHLPRFADGFCMQFLTGLYTFLWGLLFVIPGIIKAHAYRMTPYIMAENPGMKPSQAIKKSITMMEGHKMDLFCLRLSFIGWSMLGALPASRVAAIITNNIMGTPNPITLLMIFPLLLMSFAAGVALNTYTSAADAAFYRNISGQIYADNIPFDNNFDYKEVL